MGKQSKFMRDEECLGEERTPLVPSTNLNHRILINLLQILQRVVKTVSVHVAYELLNLVTKAKSAFLVN